MGHHDEHENEKAHKHDDHIHEHHEHDHPYSHEHEHEIHTLEHHEQIIHIRANMITVTTMAILTPAIP